MNFWKFLVELIHYGAWPAIVAVLLYVFRKHISDLLKSQIRVRHKETEIEFNVPLAQKQIEEIEASSLSSAKTTEISYKMYLNRVEILAVYTAAIATGNRNFVKALQPQAKETFKDALDILEKENPDCKSLDFLHRMKAQIESSGKDERKPRWDDNL